MSSSFTPPYRKPFQHSLLFHTYHLLHNPSISFQFVFSFNSHLRSFLILFLLLIWKSLFAALIVCSWKFRKTTKCLYFATLFNVVCTFNLEINSHLSQYTHRGRSENFPLIFILYYARIIPSACNDLRPFDEMFRIVFQQLSRYINLLLLNFICTIVCELDK